MYPDDQTRLRHMLDAANEAIGFLEGKNRPSLTNDRQLALSLVKCIEIVGEAASKVTEETRERMAGIPWRVVVAMRNRLIHGYYDIDLDRVWDTVTHDLPALVAELKAGLGDS